MDYSIKIEQCASLRYFKAWLHRPYFIWKPYALAVAVSFPVAVIIALQANPGAHLPWYRIVGAAMIIPLGVCLLIAAVQGGIILASGILVGNVAALLNAGRPQNAWAILNERWHGIHPSTIRKPAFQRLLLRVLEGIGDEDAMEAICFLGLSSVRSRVLPPGVSHEGVPHAEILQQGRRSRKWGLIILLASMALTVLKFLESRQ